MYAPFGPQDAPPIHQPTAVRSSSSSRPPGWTKHFALHQWGYSTVGFHAALIARADSDSDATTNPVTMSTPGSTRSTTGASGYQLGFLADVGRGWVAIGAESLSINYKTLTITQDRGGNLASTSNTTDNGVGAYVKAGLRGEHFGVFLGAGTRSKLAIGVSWTI